MRFQLRDYQKAAIQSVIQHRQEGYRRQLICLPTGAGKTVIFSELCRLAKRDVLVLAHREELLEQAKEKIERMTEGKARVSIEQGSNHASNDSNVVVASGGSRNTTTHHLLGPRRHSNGARSVDDRYSPRNRSLTVIS